MIFWEYFIAGTVLKFWKNIYEMSFISVIVILLVSKLTIFLSDIIEKICSFVAKMTFQEKVRPEVRPEVTDN